MFKFLIRGHSNCCGIKILALKSADVGGYFGNSYWGSGKQTGVPDMPVVDLRTALEIFDRNELGDFWYGQQFQLHVPLDAVEELKPMLRSKGFTLLCTNTETQMWGTII